MPYHRSRHSTTSTISPTNSAYSRRHSSISHPPPTLPSLTLLTPPLESAELLVKFLKVSYQLERLKVEWGLKVLGSKAIKNKIELTVVEDAYRNRVYNWARKWVAKQQIRELNRMQIETVSNWIFHVTFFKKFQSDYFQFFNSTKQMFLFIAYIHIYVHVHDVCVL